MDFNATIDLIIKDLDDARNIIDDLKKYPGVPALQVELAKAKCKSAGELISLLKSLGDNIPEINYTTVEPSTRQQSYITEEKKTAGSSDTFNSAKEDQEIEIEPIEIIPPPEEIIQKTEVVINTSSTEEEKTPIENTSDKPQEVPETRETEKPHKKSTESSIMADKFSHLSDRFNEQIGSKNVEDDLSDILKTKPLSNLSDAIGVNDRFLFIREIFNGDKDAYSMAISQLNSSATLSDAMSVISSFTDDSNENKATKQLLDLVKRKLTSNG